MGEWSIYRDSPEFGCSDNPSWLWFANEYRGGHWTGRTITGATRLEVENEIKKISE